VAGVSAYGDGEHYPINENIDRLLPVLNSYVKDLGLENITVPDFGYPASPVFIGCTLKDMSSVYRAGNAEMWQSGPYSLTVQADVSLKDAELHVVLAPYLHDSFSWTIKKFVLRVLFTLTTDYTGEKEKCTFQWDSFTIQELDDITTHTANPEYNNKPPLEELRTMFISQYNVILKDQQVLDQANKYVNLCALM